MRSSTRVGAKASQVVARSFEVVSNGTIVYSCVRILQLVVPVPTH